MEYKLTIKTNNETNNEEIKDTATNNTDTAINDDATDTKEELTLEQVKKLIQSETDRVRTEYVKKLKSKEQEMDELKKSNMTEQEQLDYEKKELEKVLSEREKALIEKEEAFKRSQLELQTIELLKDEQLPIEAKNFLISTNIDTTTDNVKAFKVMFDNAIAQVVGERIKNTSKTHKTSGKTGITTKGDFNKMGWKERNKLYISNPELYKELSK